MSLEQGLGKSESGNEPIIDEQTLKVTAQNLAQQFGFLKERISFIENLLRQPESKINVIIAGAMTMPLERRIIAASFILRTLRDNQKILDAESFQSVD